MDQPFYNNSGDFKKVIKLSSRGISIISTIIDEDEYENFEDLGTFLFYCKLNNLS